MPVVFYLPVDHYSFSTQGSARVVPEQLGVCEEQAILIQTFIFMEPSPELFAFSEDSLNALTLCTSVAVLVAMIPAALQPKRSSVHSSETWCIQVHGKKLCTR